MDANGRWAWLLAAWTIPEELIAVAPESPYFFDPVVFTESADEALQRAHDTPSDHVARQALSPGGTASTLTLSHPRGS